MTDRIARRTFLGTASAALAGLAPLPALAAGVGVALVVDTADPVASSAPGVWATGLLADSLSARGHSVRRITTLVSATANELRLVVAGAAHANAQTVLSRAGVTMPGGPEAVALVGASLDGHDAILAAGSDARGLVYALTELLDRLGTEPTPDAGLRIGPPMLERPANTVRSIGRLFVSEREDRAWFHDRDFWREYLTMLVSHRFNRFNLTFGAAYNYPMEVSDVYFYFAYPFLFAVPGYDVRARGLPDEERDRNLASLKFIAEETARRGLDFQMGLWTHGYAFASPRANYVIEGITPQNHAAYCSDALARLLTQVPEIRGVTLRIHGESGIREGDLDFWRTVFRGIVRAGRPVEIDMHAKGLDQATIDVALESGMPVKISPKYVGEHLGLPYQACALREVDRVSATGSTQFGFSEGSRRFTRYSYGDFMRDDRKYGIVWRVWPGTQRVLASADPVFAAATGRSASFCGADGIEYWEPLTFSGRMGSGRPGSTSAATRTGYADANLLPPRDWQKFALWYRLWGRLAYDPEAPAASWQRATTQAYGAGARDIEAALATASRILPLVTMAHGPSASNNRYWPEMYTNMSIVQDDLGPPYLDTAKPARFGTAPSFDPQVFMTVEEAAGSLLADQPDARLSPLDVAAALDGLAAKATASLEAARKAAPDTPDVRRLAADIAIQAATGRFFAAKFRSGVLWALHLRSDDATAADEALKAYRSARGFYAEAARAGEVYAGDVGYGPEPWLRGHWRDRLSAIDADIAEMARLAADTNGLAGGSKLLPREKLFAAMGEVLATPTRDRLAGRHSPPRNFKPGEALALEVGVPESVVSARLHWRPVNQAETWQVLDMTPEEGRMQATIPAAATGTPYPMQYYFELRQEDTASLWPGLGPDLAGTPYFVVRQG